MNSFTLTPKVIKVEIDCPGCERTLRIRPRPGTRELKCPACESGFNVTF
jgi:transposase-like protein